jgi:hypothetical protein
VVSYLLEYAPLDSGVEHHALAKSRETHPPKPRIEYLETIAEANALDDGVSRGPLIFRAITYGSGRAYFSSAAGVLRASV